ncbi:MAG: peptidase T [Acidobacteriota bacterium]|jgi:tripeptide aminopeptidase|nr:peptidase T [Acidobacteriota bacterium]
MDFPGLMERFVAYARINTQSDEESLDYPSTPHQINLCRLLESELNEMGLADVALNQWGYVTATLPANRQGNGPTIALIAHVDTSPDVSGENVNPQIHRDYDGKDIDLYGDGRWVLKTEDNPHLLKQKGKTLITTDGTTLLGADDKAGISEIMAALQYLIDHPEIPRPRIRVLFTPDEETGRGTEHITTEEIDADFGYTLDGEKLGEIEDETFCADSVHLKVTGINVHPGYAKGKLLNAIKVAAEIIDNLPKYRLSPETTEKREGYLHPNSIEGGSEQVMIKFLLRDFSETGLRDHEKELRRLVDHVLSRNPGASAELEVIESYRNMKVVLDQHPEVMAKALEAVKLAGVEPVRNLIRGGTDGARLSFMGLPTPNIFTGGSNFHSRYEWVTLEDMQAAARVIVHLMSLWGKEWKTA